MPTIQPFSRLHYLAAFLLAIATESSLAACSSDFTATGVPVQCSNAVSKIVDPANPTILVRYQEPTHQQSGEPLVDLLHTTIYYDIGAGTVEAGRQAATSLSGGGFVERSITIPVKQGETVTANICVTATNSAGESPPTM